MPQHQPSRPNAPLSPRSGPPGSYPPLPTGRPPGSRARADSRAATAVAPVADPPKEPDLTVNKVLAGAGAAATSAVLGSFWGAAGTVLGAALGSVISMTATTIYHRSLDRTRDTVKARIRLAGGRTVDVTDEVEVPAPPVAAEGETGQARVYVTPAESAEDPTTVLPAVSTAVPPRRPGRRWLVLTALAVGAFLIGLLAVTGVELLKGSTLTRGETGTSVGRVVDPRPVSPDTAESTETEEPTETETATPESTDETEEAPATDGSDGDTEPGADTDPDAGSATPARATPMRGRRLRRRPRRGPATADPGEGPEAAPTLWRTRVLNRSRTGHGGELFMIEAAQDGSPPADTELLDTSEPAGVDVSLKHSGPVVWVRYEVVDGQTQSAQNAERDSNDEPADISGAEVESREGTEQAKRMLGRDLSG